MRTTYIWPLLKVRIIRIIITASKLLLVIIVLRLVVISSKIRIRIRCWSVKMITTFILFITILLIKLLLLFNIFTVTKLVIFSTSTTKTWITLFNHLISILFLIIFIIAFIILIKVLIVIVIAIILIWRTHTTLCFERFNYNRILSSEVLKGYRFLLIRWNICKEIIRKLTLIKETTEVLLEWRRTFNMLCSLYQYFEIIAILPNFCYALVKLF